MWSWPRPILLIACHIICLCGIYPNMYYSQYAWPMIIWKWTWYPYNDFYSKEFFVIHTRYKLSWISNMCVLLSFSLFSLSKWPLRTQQIPHYDGFCVFHDPYSTSSTIHTHTFALFTENFSFKTLLAAAFTIHLFSIHIRLMLSLSPSRPDRLIESQSITIIKNGKLSSDKMKKNRNSSSSFRTNINCIKF